ncbi:hypothetical protein CRYUN_Cryun22dG0016200 [Craigia yunnanensis]
MEMMFSKPLFHTDISKRLAIPTYSLSMFPPFQDGRHEIELEVWDDDGKMWKFVCSIRKTGKYQKPVFSKGWLDFVIAKGLSAGDEVRLYKNENRTRLFGNVVYQLRYSIKVVKGAEASGTTSAAAGANSETTA